jgi:hypothetical protein
MEINNANENGLAVLKLDCKTLIGYSYERLI